MTVVISTSYWTPPYYIMALEDGKTPSYQYKSKNLIPRISDTQYNGSKRTISNRTIADCNGMSSLLPDSDTLESYSFNPTLTSILRLDTSVQAGKITSQVVLSEAGQIHVSRNSLYLTSNLWTPYTNNTTTPTSPRCAPNTPCATSLIWNPGQNGTLIHRFVLDRTNTKYAYSRLIPGSPLSQYSMDEDVSQNFRIVTSEFGNAQSTRLTILGSSGAVLGQITGIAPGENFQSSRFI